MGKSASYLAPGDQPTGDQISSEILPGCLAMFFALLGLTHVAVGANQPPVNLGFTSFLDGVSFAPSGLVYGTSTAEYAID